MDRPMERRTAARTAVVWDAVRALLDGPDRTGEQSVLDIGGGTGGFAVRVAGLGHRVTVVDPSPDALAALARRADEQDVADRITGLQGDFGNLRDLAPEGGVDLVLCHGVLGLVDDPADALATITSILRPGGALSLRGQPAARRRARPGDGRPLRPGPRASSRAIRRHGARGAPVHRRGDRPAARHRPGSPPPRPTASASSPTWCPPPCSTSSTARAPRCWSSSGRSPIGPNTSPWPASCTSSPPASQSQGRRRPTGGAPAVRRRSTPARGSAR